MSVRLSRFLRSSLSFSLVLAGSLAGCGGDSLSPFQPEVVNSANDFQFQATNVTNLTTTKRYSWANVGTRATVNHSTSTTAGTAQLVIRDATGATVYSGPLSASLSEETAIGQTGTWIIEVRLTRYSGTLNFRVQRL